MAVPAESLVSVSVTPGAVSATGLVAGAEVTIAAELDEALAGTPRTNVQDDWWFTVAATLERPGSAPPSSLYAQKFQVNLVRTSIEGSRGVYVGHWRPGSTHAGTWTVTELTWFDGTSYTRVDPRPTLGGSAEVTVTGSSAPTVTATRVPGVVPYGARQWVQYTYRTAAGAPIPGAAVYSSSDFVCYFMHHMLDPARVPTSPTDRLGRFTVRLRADGFDGCVDVLSLPAVRGDLATRTSLRTMQVYRYQYYRWVTAAALTSAVRIGRTLTVNGSVAPNQGSVRLQRLMGRTWRTIASANIRPSGRYTLSAPVTSLGCSYYRVVARGGWTMAPTASRTFVVVGTRR